MENDSYTRTGTTGENSSGQVTVLNTLITTLIDSVDGYQKAAQDTENTRFAEMFNARARERQQALTALQAAVGRLGGDPSADGSTTAAAHRGWINLKEAVVGRDDKAIVNEVERGEDYLKEKFEAAIGHTDLDAEARQAVEQAWQSVKAGHDEMSQLKHAIS